MNDQTHRLTIRDRADELLKRAVGLQTSLQKAVKWLKRLTQAIHMEDWLQVQNFFAQKAYTQIKEQDTLGFASELQAIEDEAQKYAVDAQIQLRKYIKEACQKEGITPVIDDGTGALTVARLIKLRFGTRSKNLKIETISKRFSLTSAERKAVFQRIVELYRKIWGRSFDPQQFVQRLYEAYRDVSEDGKEAQLSEVHDAYWRSSQPKVFFETYDLDRARDYTADMFSADLARLLESRVATTKEGKKLHLATHGGGLPVYDSQGGYQTYKFIRFDPT